VVCSHWAIEENLLCALDVSMSKDNCQVYLDNGSESLATVQQVSLNMLKALSTQLITPKK
jgi:predicted transposase YbfD/YdcC